MNPLDRLIWRLTPEWLKDDLRRRGGLTGVSRRQIELFGFTFTFTADWREAPPSDRAQPQGCALRRSPERGA